MKRRAGLLTGLLALVSLLYATIQANAQDASPPLAPNAAKTSSNSPKPPSTKPVAKIARPYFIEFRSRSALSYGHTFAVVGQVGSKITAKNVVGLHPVTESSVPWMLGHLVPVPSETGFSDGDIEDEYITARYRVLLSKAEYSKLTADIAKLKANSPIWHAALYNCNAFVADIAKSLGLRAPSNKWLLPKDFITQLKALNNGAKQLNGTITTASIQ